MPLPYGLKHLAQTTTGFLSGNLSREGILGLPCEKAVLLPGPENRVGAVTALFWILLWY